MSVFFFFIEYHIFLVSVRFKQNYFAAPELKCNFVLPVDRFPPLATAAAPSPCSWHADTSAASAANRRYRSRRDSAAKMTCWWDVAWPVGRAAVRASPNGG